MMASPDYYLDVVAGNALSNATAIQQIGRNTAVGTTAVPICLGGIYRTPQVASATALRIKSGGNANDTAAGTGARSVVLEGLSATGEYQTETIATAGASASVSSALTYLRLTRAYVGSVGAYGSASVGAAAGNIVIENAAGGTDWATIDVGTYSHGETEISCYSVPKGKQAYILSLHYSVDSSKTTAIQLFIRENILQTAAPYSPFLQLYGVSGADTAGEGVFHLPLVVPPLSDLLIMGQVSSTTSLVEVTYEMLLKDQE